MPSYSTLVLLLLCCCCWSHGRSPDGPPKDQVGSIVLVHGGAGLVKDETMQFKYNGSKLAVRTAFDVLEQGGTAVDAVMAAVQVMESDPYFNAGIGSVLTLTGHVQMDASIMDGKTMEAGSVASVTNISHPVLAARRVMDNSRHVQLAGPNARQWALGQPGVEEIDESELITEQRYQEWLDWLADHGLSPNATDDWLMENAPLEEVGQWALQTGTVGAVALDAQGNLAAATSTGGLTGKMDGRVGDSPGVGHGVFADNDSVAASLTGRGESVMKVGVARRIAYNVQEKAMDPRAAAKEALHFMTRRVGGLAGAIVLDRQGRVAFEWNTVMMCWALGRDGELKYGVRRNEEHVEEL